jgi:hypothetical protein
MVEKQFGIKTTVLVMDTELTFNWVRGARNPPTLKSLLVKRRKETQENGVFLLFRGRVMPGQRLEGKALGTLTAG